MRSGEKIRVTVWGENLHEQQHAYVRALYPDGMHSTIAAGLSDLLGEEATVTVATRDEPGQGLPAEVLEATDVLTWWGHLAHDEIDDELVERICDRVARGMGLLVLHSGHHSKVFRRLMGTSCNLRWRGEGGRELVWTVDPAHPISDGIPDVFAIDGQEMYGEFFEIPPPDELVFISSFSGGEVFRSGCCFHHGRGRVFYFGPGDQAYPVYHHPLVRRVLANGVRWAYRNGGILPAAYPCNEAPSGWLEEALSRLAGDETAR